MALAPRMVRSSVASAPTIICVLWPAGAKRRGAARRGLMPACDATGAGRAASLASSMWIRIVAIERRIAAPSFSGASSSSACCGGQLDVDAQPIGIPAGLLEQLGARLGNRLQVDVAAEVVLLAQHPRHLHHLLHRVVGALDDPRAEKQPLDAVAAVEVERELHDFVDAEARPRHVAADAVDAVQAVVDAVVGQQDLQQRDAAPVGRVAVADARALGRADAAPADRAPLVGAARGARGVVLGGVGEDGELVLEVHGGVLLLDEYTVVGRVTR